MRHTNCYATLRLGNLFTHTHTHTHTHNYTPTHIGTQGQQSKPRHFLFRLLKIMLCIFGAHYLWPAKVPHNPRRFFQFGYLAAILCVCLCVCVCVCVCGHFCRVLLSNAAHQLVRKTVQKRAKNSHTSSTQGRSKSAKSK